MRLDYNVSLCSWAITYLCIVFFDVLTVVEGDAYFVVSKTKEQVVADVTFLDHF